MGAAGVGNWPQAVAEIGFKFVRRRGKLEPAKRPIYVYDTEQENQNG